MEQSQSQPDEQGAKESQPGQELAVDIYEDLDVNNANDRLLYLVSMAFDNLAMSAGYGGILRCPYDVEEGEGSVFDDDYPSSIHSDDAAFSPDSSLAGEEMTRETDVTDIEEDSICQPSEQASDVKRVRTAFGTDDVAIEVAGKPIAVSSLASGDAPILYTGDFIQVRKSNLGGFGMFALKDLPYRQHILMERALVHADYSTSIERFNSLSSDDQQLFLDLHGHNPTDESMKARIQATFHTNNFTCDRHTGGAGVFLVASRFNHACYSRCNVKYGYDLGTDAMTFSVGKKGGVKAGEELTICYGKDRDTLKTQYGFDCQCGACDSTLREYVEEEFGKVMERIQQA